MTTNNSKFTCAYTDYPWPEDAAIFPNTRDFYEYQNKFANHFGITEHIRCGCKVQNIKLLENGMHSVTYVNKK